MHTLQRVSLLRSLWRQEKGKVLLGCLFLAILAASPVLWTLQRCQLFNKWPFLCACGTSATAHLQNSIKNPEVHLGLSNGVAHSECGTKSALQRLLRPFSGRGHGTL